MASGAAASASLRPLSSPFTLDVFSHVTLLQSGRAGSLAGMTLRPEHTMAQSLSGALPGRGGNLLCFSPLGWNVDSGWREGRRVKETGRWGEEKKGER